MNALAQSTFQVAQNFLPINRSGLDDRTDVVQMDLVTEKMDKEKLVQSTQEWIERWNQYYGKIKPRQQEMRRYYKGEHYSSGENRKLVYNMVYNALETFLPIATKNRPDPIVYADNSKSGDDYARAVRQMLVYHADRLRMPLKAKNATKNLMTMLLGAVKIAWSEKENDFTVDVVNTESLMLDPNGFVDEHGDFIGEWIGQIRKNAAVDLKLMFEDMESKIDEITGGKDGTVLEYYEWHTDDLVFWTLSRNGQSVLLLGKARNPHWNYDSFTGTDGKEYPTTFKRNHFKCRKKPFIFLSANTFKEQPFDETTPFEQSLYAQDQINVMLRQINRNLRYMNIGLAFDSRTIDADSAYYITKELMEGRPVMVRGMPREAIHKIPAEPLPPDIYNHLSMMIKAVLGTFAIEGSTPQGIANESSVGGKIIVREQDASRIGGGITAFLEGWYGRLYDWFIQMMMVHYTEEHTIPILGERNSMVFHQVKNDYFQHALTVFVKDGSMVPRDPITKRNDAITLAQMGKISNIDLLDAMDNVDPYGTAERAFIEQNAPQLLYNQQTVGNVDQAQTGKMINDMALQNAATAALPGEGVPPKFREGRAINAAKR